MGILNFEIQHVKKTPQKFLKKLYISTNTRVAFYISGLENKKKTDINHRKSLYCFSKYSPLRSMQFCMRLNQLSKYFCHFDWGISKTCILNASTTSLGVERWPLILFFTYGNKKNYTADDSSNQCFECSKTQLLEPMCESSHCRGEKWPVFGGWFS